MQVLLTVPQWVIFKDAALSEQCRDNLDGACDWIQLKPLNELVKIMIGSTESYSSHEDKAYM